MLIRHGVRLTPHKADMFDMIEHATKANRRIPVRVLADVFYPCMATPAAKNNVRVIIYQINDLLQPTDVVIKHRIDGYRVEQRKC
jgi:hypothetical protein